MRIKGSAYLHIFFVLAGLFGIIGSLGFHSNSAMFLPLGLSSAIFLLAVIELTRELLSKEKPQRAIEEKPRKEAETRAELRRFGSTWGWILSFMLGIYLLGFTISIALWVFVYLKQNRRGWLTAICFSLIITLFIYLALVIALKFPLYRGLIWELIF